jgi:hypothetical protein
MGTVTGVDRLQKLIQPRSERFDPMKKVRTFLCVLTLGLCVSFLSVLAFSKSPDASVLDSKYRVFCANGKIEVEQRTLEQQKNARGSNVCQLAEFDYLSDAEKYAEKQGGKGADCKCN